MPPWGGCVSRSVSMTEQSCKVLKCQLGATGQRLHSKRVTSGGKNVLSNRARGDSTTRDKGFLRGPLIQQQLRCFNRESFSSLDAPQFAEFLNQSLTSSSVSLPDTSQLKTAIIGGNNFYNASKYLCLPPGVMCADANHVTRKCDSCNFVLMIFFFF